MSLIFLVKVIKRNVFNRQHLKLDITFNHPHYHVMIKISHFICLNVIAHNASPADSGKASSFPLSIAY